MQTVIQTVAPSQHPRRSVSQKEKHNGVFIVQRRRANGFWRDVTGLVYDDAESALRCVERSRHRKRLRVMPAVVRHE